MNRRDLLKSSIMIPAFLNINHKKPESEGIYGLPCKSFVYDYDEDGNSYNDMYMTFNKGEKISIPVYEIFNKVDWKSTASSQSIKNWITICKNGMKKKLIDDYYRTIISAGTDRNIVVFDTLAEPHEISEKLKSIMCAIAKNNGYEITDFIRPPYEHISFYEHNLEGRFPMGKSNMIIGINRNDILIPIPRNHQLSTKIQGNEAIFKMKYGVCVLDNRSVIIGVY